MAAPNLEKMTLRWLEKKQIPTEPHWAFCYTMLHKVSRSFAFVIQQLGPELRDAVCIFYLVLRVLDTVEDNTSIATEIRRFAFLLLVHTRVFK
uniref:Squalene synthase n=1 Tax=Kalanchoe fedtschenkoi TaxID=63787 RepID=A0A7N0TWL7_KALFE